MELAILHYIQNLHNPALNSIFIGITKLLGNHGVVVIMLSFVLMAFPKTRKCGLWMLLSFLLTAVIGWGIKHILARPRPFIADPTVTMLIKPPGGYSCPSSHTALAFATAAAIYFRSRFYGVFALFIAFFIGFSRLYLFVHYPSDVLLGAALGTLCATIVENYIGPILKRLLFID